MRRAGAALVAAALLALAGAGAGDALRGWVAATALPPLVPATGTEVLDRDGRLLRAYQVADGRWRLAAGAVDPLYPAMLLAWEDRRFHRHNGIDLRALARAGWQALGRGRIVSGGNFHAEPVAFAADMIALTLAELGAIAQRRVALMVDPTLSHDLPPFLTPEPGLNSGFMIAEVTTAALMSENKHLANPCSTDSTPTSANQEDHVSMAAHGALRLRRMTANLFAILGVEALAAAQGVEFRAPLKTSAPLQAAIARLRAEVPRLEADREMAPDMVAAARLVETGALAGAAGLEGLA